MAEFFNRIGPKPTFVTTAANVFFEPILTVFCDAANVWFHSAANRRVQNLRVCLTSIGLQHLERKVGLWHHDERELSSSNRS